MAVDAAKIQGWMLWSRSHRANEIAVCHPGVEALDSGVHSRVDTDIRDHIAAGRCACDVRNPRGACCLGDVIAAVKRVESAVRDQSTTEAIPVPGDADVC